MPTAILVPIVDGAMFTTGRPCCHCHNEEEHAGSSIPADSRHDGFDAADDARRPANDASSSDECIVIADGVRHLHDVDDEIGVVSPSSKRVKLADRTVERAVVEPGDECRGHQSTERTPLLFDTTQDASLRQRGMIDRWDALVEREGRYEAHCIQRQIGPADHWRRTHLDCIQDVVCEYGIDASTTSAAFALFDRYFARGLVRRGEWSLTLMTCLYLAIKIHSSYNGGENMIDASTMSWECSGQFTDVQIYAMERRVCRDFDWRLNPPIPEMFVDIFASYLLTGADPTRDDGGCTPRSPNDADEGLDDVARDIPDEMRRELVRQSKRLCGMIVLDRNFVVARPSSIAHAAVAVAMDIMRFPVCASGWFASLPLECDPDETGRYIARLHRICSARGHTPTKVFDFPSFSLADDRTSRRNDDVVDDEDDTDISSLSRSDVAPSVGGDDEVACSQVGHDGASVVVSPKRRRIR